jgi:hypothetical protein
MGKGDRRRAPQVSYAIVRANWAAIFGLKGARDVSERSVFHTKGAPVDKILDVGAVAPVPPARDDADDDVK